MTISPLPLSVFQTDQMASFLRANWHPCNNDDVRSALFNVDTQIQCHDATIARLSAEITALKNQRAVWVKQRTKFTSLLSPVRLLPNDVLRLIFHQYVELPWNASWDPNNERNQLFVPALVLGGVCSHWNSIVHDSPKLWRIIHFDPHDESLVDDAQHHAAFLQDTILPRSKDYGLRLNITNSPSYGCPIMAALLVCVHRWEYLNLNIANDFPEEFFETMRGNIPRLKELVVESQGLQGDAMMIHPFEIAPKLRTLTLSGDPVFKSRFPWRQIQSAIIWGSLSRFRDIMEEAVSLESLKIDIFRFDDLYDWLHGSHSMIQDLTMFSCDLYEDSDDEFLGFRDFSLPALRTLRVIANGGVGYHSECYKVFKQFDGFLSNSRCTIIVLVISRTFFPVDDLIKFLALLPTIQEFTFSPDNPQHFLESSGEKLVSALDFSVSETALLPRLTSLDATIPFLSTNSLVSVVTSRWVPGATQDTHVTCQCLQVVLFKASCVDLDEDALAPLLHLRSGGLRLVLQDKSRFF